MTRRFTLSRLALPALLVAGLIAGRASAVVEDDAATAVAKQVTAAGAALFSAKDAKGLAATYLDGAHLDGVSRENDGSIKVETKNGRAEIQSFYEGLFTPEATFHARNTVDHAKKIGPDLLLITGTFETDTEQADGMKLPFTQIRQKQGNEWKIVTLQFVIGAR